MAFKQQPETNFRHAPSTDRGCSFVNDFGDILVARIFATSIGVALKNVELSASSPFPIVAWPSDLPTAQFRRIHLAQCPKYFIPLK